MVNRDQVILLSKLWNESASRDIPQLTLTSSTMSWRTSSGDHAVVALYSNIPVPWTKEGRKGGREKGKRRDGNGGGGRKDEVYPTLPFFFFLFQASEESRRTRCTKRRETRTSWSLRLENGIGRRLQLRAIASFVSTKILSTLRQTGGIAPVSSPRGLLFSVPRPETTLKPFFSFPFHFSTPLRNSTRL